MMLRSRKAKSAWFRTLKLIDAWECSTWISHEALDAYNAYNTWLLCKRHYRQTDEQTDMIDRLKGLTEEGKTQV